MNFDPFHQNLSQEVEEEKVSAWPYFFTKASNESKIKAIIALSLGVLCILSLILSAVTFANGSIFKIPALKIIFTLSGEEDMLEDLEEEAEELVEELDDILEDEDLIRDYERKHNISFEDLEDEHGITLKEYRKILKTPSLSAIAKGMTQIMGGNDDSVQVIRILMGIVAGYTALLVLLMALAVFFGKTALCVGTLLLSEVFVLLTGGVVWGVLLAVGAIGAAVLFSSMKKEYKSYRRGY